jgi:hypothetical protein
MHCHQHGQHTASTALRLSPFLVTMKEWMHLASCCDEPAARTTAALGNAALNDLANAVQIVSTDKTAWENYARSTFLAHSRHVPAGKLRFLQYVTKKDPRMVDCA